MSHTSDLRGKGSQRGQTNETEGITCPSGGIVSRVSRPKTGTNQ